MIFLRLRDFLCWEVVFWRLHVVLWKGYVFFLCGELYDFFWRRSCVIFFEEGLHDFLCGEVV